MNLWPLGEPQSSIRLSYVICATLRSGSNFLCEVLQATGIAGRPDEYFWKLPMAEHEQRGLSGFRAYIDRVKNVGTTPNGVFGVKIMWDPFGELVTRLAALTEGAESSPPKILAAAFPNLRYIWLTRHDKVRQGISWHRALKTQRWRSKEAGEERAKMGWPPEVEGPTESTFDFEAIDALVEVAAADDRAWRDFFQCHGIEPLVVIYEELERDPEQTCHRVLDFLRLPAPQRPSSPAWRHQRQADALTDDWVRRYHALKGGIPR